MDLQSMLKPERYTKMQAVLAQRTRYFSIILEDLYDPHNISAILRSAEAYGMQETHIIEGTNPFRISKGVVMGADRWLDLNRYESTTLCLDTLKARGYRVFIADPDPSYPSIEELPIDNPFLILVGQEKRGVSEEAKSRGDELFRIPLYGFVESFNVSVASAIMISQFMNILRKNPPRGFFLSGEEQEKLLQKWILKNQFHGTTRSYLSRQLEL